EVMFGIMKCGAVLVPLSNMLDSLSLAKAIKDSDSKLLFFDSDKPEIIESVKHLTFSQSNVVSFNSDGIFKSFTEFVYTATSAEPNVDLSFEDDCMIIFTSGTTGEPKGILHTHYSRLNFAITFAINYSINN